MSCRSSKPSRELIRARSAPVISPIRASSIPSGIRPRSFFQIVRSALTLRQNGRQKVLSICLASRPVAPHP